MNTGIGDAVNLAWKLAAVLGGAGDTILLDSYEAERIPFARSLVATTDRVFDAVVGRGVLARLVRTVFAPYILPLALRFSAVRRAQFRLVSQTRIAYRESPLSDGAAGEVHAGDRLPWVEGTDNFAPLKSLDWQVHVYGTATAGWRRWRRGRVAAPRVAVDAAAPTPGSNGTRCTWCGRTGTSAWPARDRTPKRCGRTWGGSAWPPVLRRVAATRPGQGEEVSGATSHRLASRRPACRSSPTPRSANSDPVPAVNPA